MGNDLLNRVDERPWPQFLRLLLAAACYYSAYQLVKHWMREKQVVEYDTNYIYITDLQQGTQTKIPLQNVVRWNRRPGYYDYKKRSSLRYSLHYLDSTGLLAKVIVVTSSSVYVDDFLKKVKAQNPAFTQKHWTHSFDYPDV